MERSAQVSPLARHCKMVHHVLHVHRQHQRYACCLKISLCISVLPCAFSSSLPFSLSLCGCV